MAQKYRTLCAGGDISRSREFFVSIALLGWAGRGEIVTRKGAREGDWIMVTGRLGGSILGRHFLFEPRVREGRFLADRFHPTSMIDISDGLVQDLEHVLRQSKKRACLDLDAVPVSDQAFKLANRHHGRALVHALTDGEDFELLFTLPPSRKAKLEREWKRKFPETSLTAIGRIRRGKPGIEWVRGERPARAPALRKKGFAHF